MNKVANQSTTYPGPPSDKTKYVANKAVDRDTTTCMRTDSIGPTNPDMTVWWILGECTTYIVLTSYLKTMKLKVEVCIMDEYLNSVFE